MERIIRVASRGLHTICFMLSILKVISFSGLARMVYKLIMDRRVPITTKLIVPASIVYLVSPIDFFPDVLLPWGRLDDILALIGAPLLFIALSPREVVLEHLRRPRTTEENPAVVETTAKTLEDEPKTREN